ncbi:MAG: type II secretion system F family protein [Actinomycetes bacterium]
MTEAVPEVAADLATGLAAGLGPFDALDYACRHRSDPLSLAARRACAMVDVGAPARLALDVFAVGGNDPRVSNLRVALESEIRSGGSALEPVAAVARAASAEQAVRRSEMAAKVSPLIQLVVALVLVPSALLLAAAVAVAGLPR